MSFLSGLFGGDTPAAPTPAAPPPAPPLISSGQGEAIDRVQQARLRARSGLGKTILSSGLGDSNATVQHKTLLGGGSVP